ncbi:MAG: phosphoribosylglycinamide formyltransferase [Spirochaetes bacterium]|nr:phosphoribosylglycinamide formyltransferase [Spirochaetota bacterium]
MFFNRTPQKKLTIAIFISSRGSNMEAILRAIRDRRLKNVSVALVVSDNPDAKGLEIARSFGVETMYLDCAPFKTKLEGAAEERIVSILREKNVDLICLAGFMRMIKRGLISAFRNRIINIHPSLLPAFPGLDAQAQAVAAKAKVSGCTIHFVDEGMDSGPIIRQAKVSVKKNDTEKTLAMRILKKEHSLYWRVLRDIVRGGVRIGA